MKLELPETLRQRRGHDFYVVPDDTPRLYATDGEGPLGEKIIHAHFFGPSQDWWLAEVDPDGIAFGYVDLGFGMGEWGQFYLPEMETILTGGGLVIIERDCYWTPKPFAQIKET